MFILRRNTNLGSTSCSFVYYVCGITTIGYKSYSLIIFWSTKYWTYISSHFQLHFHFKSSFSLLKIRIFASSILIHSYWFVQCETNRAAVSASILHHSTIISTKTLLFIYMYIFMINNYVFLVWFHYYLSIFV